MDEVTAPEMVDRLLKPAETAERLRISVTQLRRLTKGGLFPPPVMIGSQRRWRASEVDAFIERRGQTNARRDTNV